jgi:hypothetical protein
LEHQSNGEIASGASVVNDDEPPISHECDRRTPDEQPQRAGTIHLKSLRQPFQPHLIVS